MSDSKKRKKVSFWDKAEAAGEAMELGLRFVHGLLFTILFCAAAYSLGAYVWTGLGIFLALFAAPVGFVVGFFWVEIKFLLWLLLKLFLPG